MADELNKPKKKVALKVAGGRATKKKISIMEGDEADKESMGQARKTLVFLFFVMIAYVVYLVFTGQVDEFVTSLAGVDVRWIAAGVVCFLFYYVFGVLAYVLSVIHDPDSPVGIRDLMSVEASGVFFMRMTPSGVGAQPAQIFRLTRAGLSVGEAGALNFTRFVLYEAGEGVFAAIMLLFCGGYFYETFGDVTLVGIFLFGFKVVQLAAIMAMCLLPKPVMAICNWALKLAHRHRWIKEEKYNEWYKFVNTQIEVFSRDFKRSAANVPEMSLTMLVTLLQLGCMYALPYFVLRSFGEPADLLLCTASGSMLELLVNAVPLPGGTGGAEVGFAYLFKDMYGSHLAAGFIIWRAIEYLLPVLIAAPCMGMRSNGGAIELTDKRGEGQDQVFHYEGGIRSFIDTGSFTAGSSAKGGVHVPKGGVTVKPKVRKKPAAPAVSGATVTTRGAKTVVKSSAPAPKVDIEAKIAAGKAAAAKKDAGGK